MTEPRTPTGRRMLDGEIDFDLVPAFTAVILAIEHEAFEDGRTEGYWQGVRDGQHKSPELDVERLAVAYRAARRKAGAFDELDQLRQAVMIRDEYVAAPPSKKVGA